MSEIPTQKEIERMNDRHSMMVKNLCEQLGYGFVMTIASWLWIEKDPSGAIVTGPCAAFTKPCNHNGLPGHKCDLCYGCGWVFK
jgi:hypothetical protein